MNILVLEPVSSAQLTDGVYWTNLGAKIHLGEVDGKPSEKLEKVKALFIRADMKPDVQENIVHWLWQHIAGAVGYAAGFARHRDMNTYLEDKALLRKCTLSTLELFKLCELRGVNLKKFPEAGFVNFPVGLLLFWFAGISGEMRTRNATPHMPPAKAVCKKQRHIMSV